MHSYTLKWANGKSQDVRIPVELQVGQWVRLHNLCKIESIEHELTESYGDIGQTHNVKTIVTLSRN